MRGNDGGVRLRDTPEDAQVPKMLSVIAAFFRALFARRDDDFKALLMSDLGIER